jgi:hypothetical protein
MRECGVAGMPRARFLHTESGVKVSREQRATDPNVTNSLGSQVKAFTPILDFSGDVISLILFPNQKIF